jgi:hypothetical protein
MGPEVIVLFSPSGAKMNIRSYLRPVAGDVTSVVGSAMLKIEPEQKKKGPFGPRSI